MLSGPHPSPSLHQHHPRSGQGHSCPLRGWLPQLPGGTDSATYQVHHLHGSQVGSLPSNPAMKDNSRLLNTPGSFHLPFISAPHLPPSLLWSTSHPSGLKYHHFREGFLITHTTAPCSCPPSAHFLFTSLILICMFDEGTQFIYISLSSHGAEGV